jgi:photolyase PhrII
MMRVGRTAHAPSDKFDFECEGAAMDFADRVSPLGPGVPRGGDYVMYWMRTAMRASENPALDVALQAGQQLKKPVFVYQSLSERYAYASDRHHTFILEGARDVAAQLAARGIGYAFHLQRPGHRGAHLRTLAKAAALVVTEDFPVAPFAAAEGFPGWDAEVAKAAPLWRVDTSCVVPFRAVRGKPERAFTYRAEREPRWEHELTRKWTDFEPDRGPFLPDLPFEPLKLGELSIEDAVASCEIDHGVAPAHQLTGGSAAAETRWTAFVQQRLGAYASGREDPLKAANSRLSPYLHYGMISPFKIGREAHAHRSEGATKFLEELLVWRELAWSLCALEPRHATVAALPAWARATLHQHEGDARLRHSYETLCRAQTGDPLWDAAQRSLLLRGELHNSVRMTWGKAVIGWTRDAAEAMAVLIDLNHRYALDGRDPASYLGIQYCLGGFDRAFAPEVPVLGSVRPRPTEEHARRIDLAEYAQRTRTPARIQPLTVAILGAGVAGTSCARALSDAGQQVTLFDKGRGAGGRCSTRREGEHRFDHGAASFTAQDKRWLRWVRGWADEGVVVPWNDQWVAQPSMSSLLKRMAHGLDVRFRTEVSSVERHGERWRLVSTTGEGLGEYDAVVVTAPAPQTAELIKWSAPELSARAAQAIMEPQWVAMLALAEPLDLADVLEVGVGPLQRIIRDSQKPGRGLGPERWVLHANHDWSRRNLEQFPEAAAAALLDAFWAATGKPQQKPLVLKGHRWRFARTGKPLDVPCLFDPRLRIAAAGDWCLGASS